MKDIRQMLWVAAYVQPHGWVLAFQDMLECGMAATARHGQALLWANISSGSIWQC